MASTQFCQQALELAHTCILTVTGTVVFVAIHIQAVAVVFVAIHVHVVDT